MSAAVFYAIVAIGSALVIGTTIERGDRETAGFALTYCALWPLGVPLMLGVLVGTWIRALAKAGVQ